MFVGQTKITNTAKDPIEISWLSAPVLAPVQELSEQISFSGRWCGEFELERMPISTGLFKHENRRGRTSHESFPGIILLNPATSEDQGPCFAMHLGWSGNHRTAIERLSSGDIQIQMGALPFPGEIILGQGESFETPRVYCAWSTDGLNSASQKMHLHVREHILKFPKPAKPRPVTVNTWEALYFDHDPTRLNALVDAACDVGAERFVLDDGWFDGRNDDTTSLGDWFADNEKYPEGLQPLADYVRSRGMEFGLWVEPEMVNPKSNLFQANPHWALGVGSYPKVTGRNQLVLDLGNPDVSEYLFDGIHKLVSRHDIAYLKWDMNRNLVMPGDAEGRPTAYRQTRALYA